jgi:16S rRNA (uracil1498-N3)-methyltransferase
VRPPVFFAETASLDGDRIVLAGPEGRHAATARRLAAGERADVTDGAGNVAECRVSALRPAAVELTVVARRREPCPEPRLVVVQAIPKGGRGELAVELMTEAGVDEIVPWAAERCVARWGDNRTSNALRRWRSAAREAAKQSRRAWFPPVAEPVGTAGAARLAGQAALAVLLDPDAAAPLRGLPWPRTGEVVLVVGPEGGVSPAEATALTAAGAVPASVGRTVLRTSSAGALATAVVLSGCGRCG